MSINWKPRLSIDWKSLREAVDHLRKMYVGQKGFIGVIEGISDTSSETWVKIYVENDFPCDIPSTINGFRIEIIYEKKI